MLFYKTDFLLKKEFFFVACYAAHQYIVRLMKLWESDRITDVVDAYEEGLLGRFPRARYPVGKDCFTFFLPVQALPEWLGDWLITILAKPPKPDALK